MVAMLSAVKDLFANKLMEDDREPFLTLEIPGWEGQFAVLPPQFQFWNQLLLLLIIQTICTCTFSVIIYKFIVKQRGSMTSFLIGYGFICPVVMLMPYELLEFLDLQNRTLKMSLATLPSIVVFRCVEAMHGTSPSEVEFSLQNYVTYYSSLVDFCWDEKTHSRIKITAAQMQTNILRILVHFIAASLVLSYLLAHDFKPFPSNVELDQWHLTPELLYPGHLANAYLYGVLIFFTLGVGINLTAFGQNAQGWQTTDVFRNPLWSSYCPSEFWGKKWNLVVQGALKRGAFRPLRLYMPAPLAMIGCFLVSGLLHDYTWSLIFYHSRNSTKDPVFIPILWKQCAFFLYCGVTMILERPIGRMFGIRTLVQHLPMPIVSTCVVFTALPVAHWYSGDWIVGGYFQDFSLGLFRINKV